MNILNEADIKKHCPKCGLEKVLTDFRCNKSEKYGRQIYCKPCQSESVKEWNSANLSRAKKIRKSAWIKHRYGITIEEYRCMVEAQSGLCACCNAPNTAGLELGVDHDHKTGRIRGLLCMQCNVALGLVKDDPALLRKLADYLDKTSVTVV